MKKFEPKAHASRRWPSSEPDGVLSLFDNFSVAFSYLSPMVGIYSLYTLGLGTGGPRYIWTMPIVVGLMLLVALVFGELASEYPLSGALYQYGKYTIGARYGWFIGWIYGFALTRTKGRFGRGRIRRVPRQHLVRDAPRLGKPLNDFRDHRRHYRALGDPEFGWCEDHGPGSTFRRLRRDDRNVRRIRCSRHRRLPPAACVHLLDSERRASQKQPADGRFWRALVDRGGAGRGPSQRLHLLWFRIGRRYLRRDRRCAATGAEGHAQRAFVRRARVIRARARVKLRRPVPVLAGSSRVA